MRCHRLLTLLDQCKTLAQLHQLQAHLTSSGLLHTSPTLNANLIRSLSLSPSPRHALRVFAHSLRPHTNTFSFVYALNSCVRSCDRNATRRVHALSVALGHRASIHVASVTLHAYASCGDVASARALFNTIPSRDTIQYNSMISGYVHNGLPGEALDTFRRMWSIGVPVTAVTVVSVLSACARTRNLRLGSQLHGFVSKRAMQAERAINVATALLDMYAKCGLMAPAREVFRSMERKDTGAWNALIGGYVSNHRFREALGTFDALLSSGVSPDKPTLVSTLCACARLGALDVGTRIHRYVRDKYPPRLDATLGTSLLEMYAKCGCIEMSQQVFGEMAERDVVAWSSMIGGLAAHGRGRDALQLFDLMTTSGIKPDGAAFVGVLTACKHAGLVEEGLGYFASMSRDCGIVPRAEHFGCAIDLLGRAGRLGEALELVERMGAGANAVVWSSLLSACRCSSDVGLAEVCVDSLTRLGSGHCGDYVLLSNIYALKGMWDDARRVRTSMKEGNVRKKPAFAFALDELCST